MLVLWIVAPRGGGIFAAFLSCVEIEPVLHRFPTHPTPRSWVSAFWLFGPFGVFCFVLSIVNVLEANYILIKFIPYRAGCRISF